MREAAAPAGRELPVFALDVVDDDALRPGQQRRDDKPDAFAGARRRERHDVLGAVMAQIFASELAEKHARRTEQPCRSISLGVAQRDEP